MYKFREVLCECVCNLLDGDLNKMMWSKESMESAYMLLKGRVVECFQEFLNYLVIFHLLITNRDDRTYSHH